MEEQLATEPAPAGEFKLRPARIDITTKKTQGVIACVVGATATLCAHASTSGINWINSFAAFDAILVCLITLEITGRYGNRLGAAASVWAGIMFAIFANVDNTVPLSWHAASVPLFLLSVFGYLRFRSTRQHLYLRVGLLSTLLGLLTGLTSLVAPAVVLASELLLPNVDAAGKKTRRDDIWFTVTLFFIMIIFGITLGQLAPDMVPVITPPNQPHLPPFVDANLHALYQPLTPLRILGYIAAFAAGGFAGSFHVFAFCLVWMLLASSNPTLLAAPFAIMLVNSALPVTRPYPEKFVKMNTYIGLVALTAILLGTLGL